MKCFRISRMFVSNKENRRDRSMVIWISRLWQWLVHDHWDVVCFCLARRLNCGRKPTETLFLCVWSIDSQFITQVVLFVTPSLSLDAFVPVVHSSKSIVGHWIISALTLTDSHLLMLKRPFFHHESLKPASFLAKIVRTKQRYATKVCWSVEKTPVKSNAHRVHF